METAEALDRLRIIHEQLAKGEVYRGYSPQAVALSGVLGLVAAALQPWLVEAGDAPGFLRYWMIVGAGCALLAAGATLHRVLSARQRSVRWRGLTVVGQFVPCLLAGAIVTLALSPRESAIPLLPGLWAVLFALGVAASRPYLPRSATWVAGWYLAGGLAALGLAEGPWALSGWLVGVPFGLGQLGMAWVFRSARRGEV